MTTIVASVTHGCMSADTRVVNAGPMYPADKIFRIGDSLFGTAGDAFMSLVFLEWLNTKRDKAEIRKTFEHQDKDAFVVIELGPEGIKLWNGWGVPEKLHCPHYAIGSGAMSAQHAMNRGDDPEDAIKASMELDEATGGEIQTMHLIPPELKPRRKR